MSGPWENYAPAVAEAKPWERYAGTGSTDPAPLTVTPDASLQRGPALLDVMQHPEALMALAPRRADLLPAAAAPAMPVASAGAVNLTPNADAAGEAMLGALATGASTLPLAMGGAANLVGMDDTSNRFFDSTTSLRDLGRALQADAQGKSRAGATLGSAAAILPQLLAPEALAGQIVSGGTEPALGAMEKGADLPTAEKLMALGTTLNAAANLLPAGLGSNPAVRAATGGAINAGAGYAIPALEHAVAPDYTEAPTLDEAITQGGIGAILAAALGHGTTAARPSAFDSILENVRNMKFSAPGMDAPLGLPENTPVNGDFRAGARPTPPPAPGEVRVAPTGEAFTPAQGKQVLAEAIGQVLRSEVPAGLPEPTIAVDKGGTAMTSADFMRRAKEAQQAAEERRALGITPDIERSQGVRWSKQAQAAAAEADRQARLKELDGAIAAREKQNTPARGRNALPDEGVDDALTFLAKSGGLERRAFIKEGLDPVLAKARENLTRGGASRPLFRAQGNGGMSLDDAARTLWQHGYLDSQDNNAALNLILSGVNQGEPTYSIHRAAQDDLMQLRQARQDAENHVVDDYADVPFSRKAGSTDRPLPRDRMEAAPLGAWVEGGKVPGVDHPDLFQVRDVPLDQLHLPELDSAGELVPEKARDGQAYADRLKRGEQAPNARGYELPSGQIKLVDGHRRAVAARLAGRSTLRVAVSPINQPSFSFAGERARTADRGALEQARAMEAMGRDSVPDRFGNQPGSPEDTHIATGWHRGVDGKWRFEIDDSQASIARDLVAKLDENQPLHVRDALDHPALFEAYPELARVRLKVNPEMKGLGAYQSADNAITIRDPYSYAQGGDGSLKSVLLHEIQHAIQNHEGFARGGSTAEARTLPEFEQALRQQMAENGGELPPFDQVKPSKPDEIKAAQAVYRRLAGEVEARNTQRRLPMDAAQRRATPPTETADVPRSQQIVRFNADRAMHEESSHAESDARHVERYNAVLSKYLGADVHFTPAAHVPDAARRALDAFDRAYGGRTIVIRNDTPETLDLNGVTLRDGVRLVNEDATSPLLTVAGHEMLHQLRKDAPDLYRELVDEVRRQGRLHSYEAVLNDRAKASGEQDKTFSRDEVEEELTADAAGDALSDPDFLERMAQRNPGLFREMADRLRAFFDSLVQRLRRSLGSSNFLDDVEAFRTKLADVLERYATRQQGEAAPHGETDPAFQRVYHGTPHTVDKFSLQKIGTGEGAQAYGWGMYFASARDVAEHYRRSIRSNHEGLTEIGIKAGLSQPGARALADAYQQNMKFEDFERITNTPSPIPAIEAFRQDLRDTMGAAYNAYSEFKKPGNLYRVEVPEDHDLLDWDKPITGQPPKVRAAMEAILASDMLDPETRAEWDHYAPDTRTGRRFYRLVAMSDRVRGGERGASEVLNKYGIPGLRYLDGLSRTKAAEGTANYVIWDEGAIGAPEQALSRKPADDQTQTPAFRKWFGDSKVVDAEGKPLVVYHGTRHSFDEFRRDGRKGRDRLHYFTDDPAVASEYAGDARYGTPNVMPAYVSLQKPFTFDAAGEQWGSLPLDIFPSDIAQHFDERNILRGREGQTPRIGFSSVIRGAVEAGYDGVIADNIRDGGGPYGDQNPSKVVVAHRPEQIKSATGNRGTFDPEEPSILFSRKPAPGSTTPADLPSRRPGESQAAYARRVTRKSADQIKLATELAKRQKTINRQLLRAKMAGEARALATADAALAEARKAFDKTPDVINYASVHQFETGQPIADADFRAFAKTMQDGFDQRIAEIHRLAPDALKSLIEHYMPHLYQDSGKAIKWYQGVMGKRPLDGDKSFLKQRTWPTLKEAMASGLKPISPNPVDWVLMKYHQMDKFIGLLRYREELQKRGWILKMEAGQRAPEGFARVDNPAFQIAGGLQGHYVVPEGMARDINTLLAPGLEQYGAWRSFRAAQNALVSANLGFSAFHAAFTSTDNVVTHFGVGLNRLAMGDLAGGIRHVLEAIPTIAVGPFHGAKLNRQWLGQEAVDPHTAALLDLLEQGGARYKNSPDLVSYNNALPSIARGLRRLQAPGYLPDRADDLRRQLALDGPLATGGKVVWEGAKGIGRAFSAVGELGSYAIHHVLVPNQKMAARITLLKMELDRYAEQLGKRRGDYAGIVQVMHPDVARQLASEVVDRVDFRLGQMIYDNFFVPKIARQVAQALLLAPGWLAGGVQTAVGGVRDLPRLVKPAKLVAPLDRAGTITDAHRGRIGNNLTSLAALFLIVGGANAVFQYLMTGEGPRELRDLVAPRTGRKNADDSDERITSPNYLKDHYELVKHPLATLGHKLNPSLRMLRDLAYNEDYFGNMIRDPHHGAGQQAKEIAAYILKGMLPLSVQNVQESRANGDSAGQMAAGFFGFNPAPASLNRSAFQAFVAKGGAKGWDFPAATPAEAEYQDRRRAAEHALRTGQTPDLSGLDPRDVATLKRKVRTPTPELQFDRLGLADKLDAYEMATPAERQRYHLTAILARTTPQRSVAFRRLPEEERRALLARLARIRREAAHP